MPKQLPRRDFQDLEKLYTGRETDDVTRIDRKPPRPLWHRLLLVGVGLIVAASIAAWAGFYLFGSYTARQTSTLEVAITAPESVAAGAPFTYRLLLTNKSSQVLQDVAIRVNYPEGFLWKSATLSPEGEGRNTWTLSAIAPGEAKEIAIDGMLFGDQGSVRTVFALATYSVPNFRSTLQASNSGSIKLEGSPLALTWDAPAQAVPNAEVEYKIKYTFDGEAPLPDSVLLVQLPVNFAVTSTDPAPPEANSLRWSIANISRGATGEFTIKGQWDKDTNGEQVVGALMQTNVAGSALPIVKAEAKTMVSGGDLILTLKANGQEVPSAVSLGSTIRWTLHYQNNGDQVMTDNEMRVRFDGGLVDWGQLQLSGGASVDNQTIRWTSGTTPALARIEARASGELAWETKVPASGSGSIIATPSFVTHKLNDHVTDRTFDGPAVKVPVSTPLTLSVDARYFDEGGASLGTGPLPPQVGQPTTYRLRWKLSGTVHALKNVTVSTTLPDEVVAVSGTGITSFGQLTFSDTHSPVWKIAAVEAGLEPSAEFDVTLTPDNNDVGRILVLSGRTTVAATDASTNGTITAVGGVATTNLDGDATGRGKGIVVE